MQDGWTTLSRLPIVTNKRRLGVARKKKTLATWSQYSSTTQLVKARKVMQLKSSFSFCDTGSHHVRMIFKYVVYIQVILDHDSGNAKLVYAFVNLFVNIRFYKWALFFPNKTVDCLPTEPTQRRHIVTHIFNLLDAWNYVDLPVRSYYIILWS